MGLGGYADSYSFKKTFTRGNPVLRFFYRNGTCILWLYCSVFEFFPKITNDFVGRHRYGYSILWFSDMAYTQRKSLCKFHFFLTFYNFLYRMVFNSFYYSGLGFQYCQR